MRVKRQIVYIAGKYRSRWGLPGRTWHIYKAWLAGRRLVKQGYSVYVPHLNTVFMDKLQPDEFFLDATIKMLPKCQIIYMMSGWESSVGAVQEYQEAKKRGMTIWYEDVDDTLEDVQSRCIEAQIDMNPNWGKLVDCTPLVNCQIKTESEEASK